MCVCVWPTQGQSAWLSSVTQQRVQGCSNVLDGWPSWGKDGGDVLGALAQSPVSTEEPVALGGLGELSCPLCGTPGPQPGVLSIRPWLRESWRGLEA